MSKLSNITDALASFKTACQSKVGSVTSKLGKFSISLPSKAEIGMWSTFVLSFFSALRSKKPAPVLEKVEEPKVEQQPKEETVEDTELTAKKEEPKEEPKPLTRFERLQLQATQAKDAVKDYADKNPGKVKIALAATAVAIGAGIVLRQRHQEAKFCGEVANRIRDRLASDDRMKDLVADQESYASSVEVRDFTAKTKVEMHEETLAEEASVPAYTSSHAEYQDYLLNQDALQPEHIFAEITETDAQKNVSLIKEVEQEEAANQAALAKANLAREVAKEAAKEHRAASFIDRAAAASKTEAEEAGRSRTDAKAKIYEQKGEYLVEQELAGMEKAKVMSEENLANEATAPAFVNTKAEVSPASLFAAQEQDLAEEEEIVTRFCNQMRVAAVNRVENNSTNIIARNEASKQ